MADRDRIIVTLGETLAALVEASHETLEGAAQ